MLISLTAEDPRFDQQFLGNYSLINIKDILARIKGIGRVNVLGASDYSMRIWIKPDRLAHLGISVPEIVDAIRAQSVVVPGGKFGAEPAPPGTEFTYTVRLPDRLQMPKKNSAKSSSGRPRMVPRSSSSTSPGWNWGWRPTTPLRA
jgi:HAE1 family hydrophobic/amphiphilic exporter-1